jgi:alkylhydroperoxidase/carboxymuconolactone decarboxylase family protein YurZ
MNRAARATVAGAFHAALPLENLLIQTFSTAPYPTAIPPKERERVLIAVLCTTSPTSFQLAVHFYWALMVGMEPGEIAWTLLLTGFYSGISHFSSALALLVKTLHVLKASASERTQSEAVLAALTSALAS